MSARTWALSALLLSTMSAAQVAGRCSTVAAVAEGTPALSMLRELAVAADLADALSDPEAELTVFAPPNAAFVTLTGEADPVPELTEDTQALSMLLQLHVVQGAVRAEELMDGQILPTLSGLPLKVSKIDGVISLESPLEGTIAVVTAADIEACASVVHVIDTVLLPGQAVPAASENEHECQTVAELAKATPEFSTLRELVVAAGLADALSSPDAEFTIFAPPNSAFVTLTGDANPVPGLTQDKPSLSVLLQLHVVEGAIKAADLADGQTLTTLVGLDLTVSITDGVVALEAPSEGTIATVTQADVPACAAVVHVIDAVLLPGEANAEVRSTTRGDAMMVEEADGMRAEEMMDAADSLDTEAVLVEEADADCTTVAEIVELTPEFSTLRELVVAAGLADALSNPAAELTVFAPPNSAFVTLTGEDDPVPGLAEDASALAMLLQLHVVEGVINAADLADGQTLTTLVGLDLTVSITDGVVTLEAPSEGTIATITEANVAACAAVVHVIDTVLLPGEPAGSESGSYGGQDAGAGSYGSAVAPFDGSGDPVNGAALSSGTTNDGSIVVATETRSASRRRNAIAIAAGSTAAGMFVLLAVGAGIAYRSKSAGGAAAAGAV